MGKLDAHLAGFLRKTLSKLEILKGENKYFDGDEDEAH
jgi:hypothetical protein